MLHKIILYGTETNYYYDDETEQVLNNKLQPVKIYPVDKHHRYSLVRIYIDGKIKSVPYHRLKMMIMCPVENMEDLEVNHKDGDRTNNDLSNLEWVTHSENVLHAFRTGLMKPQKGTTNGNCKLSDEDVIQICDLLMQRVSENAIGKMFNVSGSTVHAIKSGVLRADLTQGYNFPRIKGNVKYTEDFIESICKDLERGVKSSDICDKYNIKMSLVKDIRLKRCWRKITNKYNFEK